eukprot:GDKI01047884.1.p1 GENE.GDKI01047884.1~~GDKI01047884.1.p1  ORF type:complete len:266 (-),score=67.77 GDKI01047884.1:329-1126(-)
MPYGWVQVTGWEQTVQLVTSSGTNLIMLPAAILAWQYKTPIDSVIFLFTIATSAVYHATQTLNASIFRGDHGKWHQADNIFAISTFMNIILLVAQLEDEQLLTCVKLCGLCVITVMQLLSPWDIDYTISPIVLTVVCVAVYRAAFVRKLPEVVPRNAVWGLVSLVCAVVCYSKGLDDEHDYLRLWHSCWHAFIGIAAWHAIKAFTPPALLASRVRRVEAVKKAALVAPFVRKPTGTGDASGQSAVQNAYLCECCEGRGCVVGESC